MSDVVFGDATTAGSTGATEPLTLADAKSLLRVSHSSDDDRILALIEAARQHVEHLTGRAMINRACVLRLENWPPEILLPIWPVYSVNSVKYIDESGELITLTSGTDYVVDADKIRIRPAKNKSWPVVGDYYDAVQVSYTAGYGTSSADVPDGLRQLVRYFVASWYDSPDSGGGFPMFATVPLPPHIQALITQYRVPRLYQNAV